MKLCQLLCCSNMMLQQTICLDIRADVVGSKADEIARSRENRHLEFAVTILFSYTPSEVSRHSHNYDIRSTLYTY